MQQAPNVCSPCWSRASHPHLSFILMSAGTKLLLVGQLVQGHEPYLRALQRWVLEHGLSQARGGGGPAQKESSPGNTGKRWIRVEGVEGSTITWQACGFRCTIFRPET